MVYGQLVKTTSVGGEELGYDFPVAPAHPTPHAARRFVAAEGLAQRLEDLHPENAF